MDSISNSFSKPKKVYTNLGSSQDFGSKLNSSARTTFPSLSKIDSKRA